MSFERRRLGLWVALLALLAVVVSACGSNGEPTAAQVGPPGCPDGTTQQGEACVAESDPVGQRIVETIERQRASRKLKAVLFGVQRGDQVLAVGAVGHSTTDVPATGAMHYRIGNISAGFLTTALLLLVEDGKLSIDDPIAMWFPELPDADRITIEMLASSTSGYRHFPADERFLKEFDADPFRSWTADELIRFGTQGGPTFPPGSSWLSSDTNLVILGKILGKVEGKPAGQIIKKRILDPLDLKATESPLSPALPAPVLHSFTEERGLYEEATFWNPTWQIHSGSMTSNLSDMLSWAKAVGTGSLLSAGSHEIQTGPRTVGKGPLTAGLYYNFGLGGGNDWVFTTPRLMGYTGALAYLPDEDLRIVLATTQAPGANVQDHHAAELFVALSRVVTPSAPPELG